MRLQKNHRPNKNLKSLARWLTIPYKIWLLFAPISHHPSFPNIQCSFTPLCLKMHFRLSTVCFRGSKFSLQEPSLNYLIFPIMLLSILFRVLLQNLGFPGGSDIELPATSDYSPLFAYLSNSGTRPVVFELLMLSHNKKYIFIREP